MKICNCRDIDEETIREEIMKYIKEKTKACTGCGQCECEIREIIEDEIK